MTTPGFCFFQTHNNTVIAVMTDDATYRTTWYNKLITNSDKGPKWLSTVKDLETRSADEITAAHLIESIETFSENRMDILKHVPIEKIIDNSEKLNRLLEALLKESPNGTQYVLNQIGGEKLKEIIRNARTLLQLISTLASKNGYIDHADYTVLLFIQLVGAETLVKYIETKQVLDILISLERKYSKDSASTIETALDAINSVEKLHAWLLTSDSSGRNKKMLLLGDKKINEIITTAEDVTLIEKVIPEISTRLPENSPALLSIQLEAAKVELTGLIADYDKKIKNPGIRDVTDTLKAKLTTAAWLLRKVSGENPGPLSAADSTLALAKGYTSNKLPALFDRLPQDVRKSLHDESTKDATSAAALTSGNSGATFSTPPEGKNLKFDSAIGTFNNL
jgi:hypothetical protein